MPVRLAPSFCTAAAKGLAQRTVNEGQLESAARGCMGKCEGGCVNDEDAYIN